MAQVPGQYISPPPYIGYSIAPPATPPQIGDVIIGWEVIGVEPGCSCDLNNKGIVSLVITLLLFWPLMFVVLCNDDCKRQRQRPIFGPPGTVPHPSVAVPIPTAGVAGPPPPVTGVPVPLPPKA